jgi:hypothetical protein
MLRHIALFKFSAEFPNELKQQWLDAFHALESVIPELRAITVAFDLVKGATSFDAALVADFDDMEGLKTYSAHPSYQAASKMSSPYKESVAVVDYYL